MTTNLAIESVLFDFTIDAVLGTQYKINGSVTGAARNTAASNTLNFLQIEAI